MGTLVAMRYPTATLAYLADHTYVRCGTSGKAWSCWGGKIGGAELRRGAGSTRRANAIAQPNERAGIRCYLINGVCHQAANRILLPAEITVRGARGYEVSEALFGPYGRPRGPFGTCASPFDQHTGVTGDLPECADALPTSAARRIRKGAGARSLRARRDEQKYIRGALAIYREAQPLTRVSVKRLVGPDLEDFHVKLFMHQVEYKVRGGLDRSRSRRLQDVRRSTERSRMKVEEWFNQGDLRASEFVKEFDRETILFQEATARVLTARQYKALFDLAPGETVILADPRIVNKVFGGRSRKR